MSYEINKSPASNEFDALSHFSREEGQTGQEVFDLVQERMASTLGYAIEASKTGPMPWVSLSNIPPEVLRKLEDWKHSDLIFDSSLFESVGKTFGLTMSDMLGPPNIGEEDRKAITGLLGNTEVHSGIDPVKALVVMSAVEQFDQFAHGKSEAFKGIENDVKRGQHVKR